MKIIATFLLLVCSAMAFGQKVTVREVRLIEDPPSTDGFNPTYTVENYRLAGLYVAFDIMNTKHLPVTMLNRGFTVTDPQGNVYEPSAHPYGFSTGLPQRVNPWVTVTSALFSSYPTPSNVRSKILSVQGLP
jgi:hypothetical protein